MKIQSLSRFVQKHYELTEHTYMCVCVYIYIYIRSASFVDKFVEIKPESISKKEHTHTEA